MQKYSILKSELNDDADEYDFTRISKSVKYNLESVEKNLSRAFRSRPFLLDKKYFSIAGSIIVSSDELNAHTSGFFHRSRRCVKHGNVYHLRGGRYLISSNPTFELRQKLDNFLIDFEEGLEAVGKEQLPKFRFAIADYIKNSIITMFNSFLHEEKTGKYKFSQKLYQINRKAFQTYAQHSVSFYLGCLVEDPVLMRQSLMFLKNKKRLFTRIQTHILDEYQRGVFSSRHITRPEASHPLLIAAAAHHFTYGTKDNCETIIGLPAGSTELALAHSTLQKYWHGRECDVLLLPVSLHSGKNEFDNYKTSDAPIKLWMSEHVKKLSNKNIVIVDDNSSTGRTLDFVSSELILKKPMSIHVAIAEADIIRSKIDMKNPQRSRIASISAYKHSVNILPILKNRYKKMDLKEIIERRRILACTRSRYHNTPDKKQKYIIGNIYVSMINDPVPDYYSSSENTIANFRHTFLSNFHEVEIEYEGQKFRSVEHAYQAMKFNESTFQSIEQWHVDVINRSLRKRNVEIEKEDIQNLFTNPALSAGTSKIAANQLRILGFVRKDWDYAKLPIMVDLVLQKFSVPELYNNLIATNEKWLVEGNDWDDTYWGVCNGRGRNVLGRLLMEIRELDLETISMLATKRNFK